MKREEKTVQKYYQTLAAMEQKLGLEKEFHHSDLKEVVAKMQVSALFQQSLSRLGVIHPTRFGFYKMVNTATPAIATSVYKDTVDYYHQKREEHKKKEEAAKGQILMGQIIPPSVSIDECIEILKSAGYKIMKQTVTFEEI